MMNKLIRYADPGMLISQRKLDDYYLRLENTIRNWNAELNTAFERLPFLRYLPQDQVIELVLFTPKILHLLISLLNHRMVSKRTKFKIAGALGYFISPVDLIPEAVVGPVGYVDDVEIAVKTVDKIFSGNNSEEKNIINYLWQGSPRELDNLRALCKTLSILQKFKRHKNNHGTG